MPTRRRGLLGKEVINMSPRAVGYLRVSTRKQEVSMQKMAIYEYCAKHGFKIDEEVGDMIHVICSSTKGVENRMINRVYELEEGDHLLFYSISRLARTLRQANEIIEDLYTKGVVVHLIKEGLVLDSKKPSPAVKMFVNILASFAQFEREQLSERTKDGLYSAMAAGRMPGPKKGSKRGSKLDKYTNVILTWYCERNWSKARIARKLNDLTGKDGEPLGCSWICLHNFLKRRDIACLIKIKKEEIENQENELITRINPQ